MKKIFFPLLVLAQLVFCNPREEKSFHENISEIDSQVGFLEITTFKLLPNESIKSFRESAILMQKDFLEKQKGFSKRTLNLTTDSKWIDIVYWADKESFEMAMKNAENSKLATQFIEKIDPNSIIMKFVNLNKEQ